MLSAGDRGAPRTGAGNPRGEPFAAPANAIPVLVVDDDPYFCAAVERTVARTAFRPFVVGNGCDALRFLIGAPPIECAPRPAFVVLDFNLHDWNAPHVLADVRAEPACRTLPVLVAIQIPARADEQAALPAAAQAYRSKPSRVRAPRARRRLLADAWRS